MSSQIAASTAHTPKPASTGMERGPGQGGDGTGRRAAASRTRVRKRRIQRSRRHRDSMRTAAATFSGGGGGSTFGDLLDLIPHEMLLLQVEAADANLGLPEACELLVDEALTACCGTCFSDGARNGGSSRACLGFGLEPPQPMPDLPLGSSGRFQVGEAPRPSHSRRPSCRTSSPGGRAKVRLAAVSPKFRLQAYPGFWRQAIYRHTTGRSSPHLACKTTQLPLWGDCGSRFQEADLTHLVLTCLPRPATKTEQYKRLLPLPKGVRKDLT